MLIVSVFCAYIILRESSTSDQRTFATSFLTLIIGALVGYYTGGKGAK